MAETIPDLLKEIKETYPEYPAQYSKDAEGVFHPTTYAELYRQVTELGSGLLALGIKKGDHVGLISDNRKEWFVCDLAILSIGAADVPRGCDSTQQEIAYILGFAECRTVFAENEAQLEKILGSKKDIPTLKRIVVLDESFHPSEGLSDRIRELIGGVEIMAFRDLMDQGREYLEKHPDDFEEAGNPINKDDLATIIFTSGTTGEPKGVMLSHEAFLNQVRGVPKLIHVGPGDIWLAVLPVWHSFERIMQYVALGTASALAYSKPIGKIMLEDFQKIRPTWMASVPRIWSSVKAGVYRNVTAEGGIKKALFLFFVAVAGFHASLEYMVRGLLPQFKRRSRILDFSVAIIPYILVYPLRALGSVLVFKKIKQKLGGRFVAGISGGGALPPDVDKFFAAAGILLLEGYGLTETAPVLGVRAQDHPVPGTVGPIFPGMEIKIVDEQGNTLPPGNKGLVKARGPQIMMGYYRKPELTDQIIDDEGWLDTGDLGMLTHNNELKIMGRAKDTIVLLGGENIEPNPIEQKLQESGYIDQSIVLGQDQKFLAALLVPNFDEIETFAKENNVSYMNIDDLIECPEIIELFNDEIYELVSTKNGFKPFERIFRFKLLTKPFELGDELSQKQEIKRHVITEKYDKEIRELFT
jgi:long-chain acyl-CoA synthetase